MRVLATTQTRHNEPTYVVLVAAVRCAKAGEGAHANAAVQTTTSPLVVRVTHLVVASDCTTSSVGPTSVHGSNDARYDRLRVSSQLHKQVPSLVSAIQSPLVSFRSLRKAVRTHYQDTPLAAPRCNVVTEAARGLPL